MKNLKIFTSNVEQEAIDQINTLLDQPAFADCKVRIMPDVHAGAGCVWYDEHKAYMKLSDKTRRTVDDILTKLKAKLDEVNAEE